MRESWDRLTNSKSKSFKQSKSHVQELSKKVPINPISWTYSFATKIEQHPCCPATSLWSSLTTASLLRHHCSTPELIMQQKLYHRSSLQHICFLGSVPVSLSFLLFTFSTENWKAHFQILSYNCFPIFEN